MLGNPWRNERLQWVDVVVAYVLLHGRADWPSTWIDGEQSAPGVFLSREAADAAAHAMLCPGSTFYIREIPALSLRTEDRLEVLVDLRQTEPFASLDVGLFAMVLKMGTPLTHVLSALNEKSPCWRGHATPLLQLAADANESVTMAHRRRLTNWSCTPGADASMHWHAQECQVDRTRVNAVRSAFLRINSAAPTPPGTHPMRRATDHEPDPRWIEQPSAERPVSRWIQQRIGRIGAYLGLQQTD